MILSKMFPNVMKATSSFVWNLHDIMSRPSDPKNANKLWRVSRSLPSFISPPLIFIVQLEDGICLKTFVEGHRSTGELALAPIRLAGESRSVGHMGSCNALTWIGGRSTV